MAMLEEEEGSCLVDGVVIFGLSVGYLELTTTTIVVGTLSVFDHK